MKWKLRFVVASALLLSACGMGGFPTESELKSGEGSAVERASKHTQVYKRMDACIVGSCGSSTKQPHYSIEAIKCNTLRLAREKYRGSCDLASGALPAWRATSSREGCSLDLQDIGLLYESMRLLRCL